MALGKGTLMQAAIVGVLTILVGTYFGSTISSLAGGLASGATAAVAVIGASYLKA